MSTDKRAKVKKMAAKKVAKKAGKKVEKKVAKKVKKMAKTSAAKVKKPTSAPVSRRKKAAKRTGPVAITPVPSPAALAIEPARAFSGAGDKRPESVLAMSAQIISRHQEYARAATAQWWRLWTAPMRLAGRSQLSLHAREREQSQDR
jgi:hypothetical protein